MAETQKTVQDPTVGLLQQIQAQLNSRQGLDKFAAAFVKAWAEMPNVVKNSNNPHIGNDYADLAACLDTVKPTLAKYGLAPWMAPGKMNPEGTRVSASVIMFHESGQYVAGDAELPCCPTIKGGGLGPSTAQTVGSAITYIRRYLLMAICGIAPVDDDGYSASRSAQSTPSSDEAPAAEEPKKRGPGRPRKEQPATTEAPEEPEPDADGPSLKEQIKAIDASADGAKDQLTKELKPLVLKLNDKDTAQAYADKLMEINKAKK